MAVGKRDDVSASAPTAEPTVDSPKFALGGDEPLVISSLVVEALPEKVGEVADALVRFAGVEVHEVSGAKLVVTIEAPDVATSHATAAELAGIAGVLGVNLVYVNFEDEFGAADAADAAGAAEGGLS